MLILIVSKWRLWPSSQQCVTRNKREVNFFGFLWSRSLSVAASVICLNNSLTASSENHQMTSGRSTLSIDQNQSIYIDRRKVLFWTLHHGCLWACHRNQTTFTLPKKTEAKVWFRPCSPVCNWSNDCPVCQINGAKIVCTLVLFSLHTLPSLLDGSFYKTLTIMTYWHRTVALTSITLYHM